MLFSLATVLLGFKLSSTGLLEALGFELLGRDFVRAKPGAAHFWSSLVRNELAY